MTNRKSKPKAGTRRPHGKPASPRCKPDLSPGLVRARRDLTPSTHASSPYCGHPLARRLPPSWLRRNGSRIPSAAFSRVLCARSSASIWLPNRPRRDVSTASGMGRLHRSLLERAKQAA